MSTQIYSIWCEWDIGQEGQHFSSREKAMKWLQEDENLKEIMESSNSYKDVDALINAGLVTIQEACLD